MKITSTLNFANRTYICCFLMALICCIWTHESEAVLPIEQAQREYQARYKYLNPTANYLTWPASTCSCDDNLPAPHYPPDGFYDKEQLKNPFTASALVADIADKFYGTKIIYGSFLQNDPEGASTLVYHNSSTMPDIRPITIHNYESALNTILNNLEQLSMITVGATDGITSHWSWNGIDQRANKQGYSNSDCDEAKDAASSVSWANYVCSHDIFDNVFCQKIHSLENSRSLSPSSFDASLTAVRSKIWADLTGKNGDAKCYIKLKPYDPVHGAGSHPSPVQVDQNYHHFDDATPGAQWRSKYLPEDLPSFASSSCGTTNHINYGWVLDGQVIVNYPDFVSEADSADRCGENNDCETGCNIGSVNSTIGSISVKISLGKESYGSSAGYLKIYSTTPDVWIANPVSLQCIATNFTKIVGTNTATAFGTNKYTYLRQVKVAQGLADIIISNDYSYSIRFYHNGDFSGSGTAPYTINTGAVPFARVLILNPDGTNDNTRLFLSEGVDSVFKDHEYSWDSGGNQWGLKKGSPGNEWRIDSAAGTNSSNQTVTETNTTYNSSSNAVYRKVTEWTTYPLGKVITREIVDPDNSALTTEYIYYTNSLADGSAYGNLKKIIKPTGSWIKYEYGVYGRLTRVWEQYLDATDNNDEENLYVTDYSYASNGNERITTEVRKLKGVEVGRNYTIYRQDETVDIRCVTPGASITANDNLVSTSYYFSAASGLHSGKLKKQTHADGTLSLYSYTYNTTLKLQTIVQSNGLPNATFSTITNGTRAVTVLGYAGNLISTYSQDILTGIILDGRTVSQTNRFSQPVVIDYFDGTQEQYTYACCGVDSFKNREAIYSYYTRDDAGREIETEINGITYKKEYAPFGGLVRESRVGTNGNEIVQTRNGYDLAGRLTNTIDAMSSETIMHEYIDSESGHTFKIKLFADGSSITNEYYQDGSLYKTAGTREPPKKYEYGVTTNGPFTKEIKLGSGGEETEWIKQHFNMLGDLVLIEYPDGASESRSYSKGRLTQTVDPDGIIHLYSYDGFGNQKYVVLDVNRNTTIDFAGDDQIVQNEYGYLHNGITNVRYISTYVWPSNGVDQSLLVMQSQEGVNGLSRWTIAYGQTNGFVSTYDGSGGRTEQQIMADGSQILNTFSFGDKIAMAHTGSNGEEVAEKTFQYDAHGRLYNEIDTRNGETTYSYDNADRITQVLLPAHTSGAARLTQEYDYDIVGRTQSITSPGNIVLSNYYNLAGQIVRVNGSGSYPVEYDYDAQGRLVEMRTFGNATETNDFAATTWSYDNKRGFLASKTYHDSTSVIYSNSLSGKITRRQWARGVVTQYAYDNAGRLAGVTYSDATPSVSNAYNRLGQLTSVGDGVGFKTWSVIPNGNVAREDYVNGHLSGSSISREFDEYGRVAGLTVSNTAHGTFHAVGYTYDGASRLIEVDSHEATAAYTYVPNATLVASLTITNSAGLVATTEKDYDFFYRLVQTLTAVTGTTVSSYSYEYDQAGRRTSAVINDGTHWDYTYDGFGQLESAVRKLNAGEQVAGYDYTFDYDDIGNRLISSRGGVTNTYLANMLNQYTQQIVQGIVHLTGGASSNAVVTIGNSPTIRQAERFYKQVSVSNQHMAVSNGVDIVAVLPGAGSNGMDIVTKQTRNFFTPKNPIDFEYDADGNLTRDGRWNYTWDGENRLIAMETISTVTSVVQRCRLEFDYDHMSRRINKRVLAWDGGDWIETANTGYLYDGWLLVAELSASGFPMKVHTWGLDLATTMQGAGGVGGLLFSRNLPNTNELYFVYDGNGNVTELINIENKSLSGSYEYDPFGKITRTRGEDSQNNAFRFSTKYTDLESDLLYFGFRFYNPELGKWLNRDPLLELGGMNIYAFTLNNPLLYVDTDGRGLFSGWGDKINLDPCPSCRQSCLDWVDRNYRKQLDELDKMGRKCRFFVKACSFILFCKKPTATCGPLPKPPIGQTCTKLTSESACDIAEQGDKNDIERWKTSVTQWCNQLPECPQKSEAPTLD